MRIKVILYTILALLISYNPCQSQEDFSWKEIKQQEKTVMLVGVGAGFTYQKYLNAKDGESFFDEKQNASLNLQSSFVFENDHQFNAYLNYEFGETPGVRTGFDFLLGAANIHFKSIMITPMFGGGLRYNSWDDQSDLLLKFRIEARSRNVTIFADAAAGIIEAYQFGTKPIYQSGILFHLFKKIYG